MKMVQTVNVTMAVPKEGKEVIDSVAAIIEHFKSGKSLVEASALLPGVMSAVENVGAVGEEVKSVYNDELAGYTVHRVFSALKGPEVVQG